MKTELRLLTEDHPEANGRQPLPDDHAYMLRFPLDDGRELVLGLGDQGFEVLTQMLFDMLSGAPSYGDGSTNAG